MADFIIYNSAGEKVGTLAMPSLFETPVDEKLIHRYFIWVRTMLRHTVAHTKTRGEVRGGGKKPWKQKGTGRARSGSTRNPIWRKGGTIFGPLKSQTYETRMPRQERRKAFFGALAAKANNNGIMLIDDWKMTAPKTKDAVTVLANLKVSDKKVLYVHGNEIDVAARSMSNLPNVTFTNVQQLNVIQILHNDAIIMMPEVVGQLELHFTPVV